MFDHYDAHGLPIACDAAEAQVRSLRVYVGEVIAERDEARAAIAAELRRHREYEGRCVNCITWCDCDSDIVDRHQHNIPWPCPTYKALTVEEGTSRG